jgi:ACR3 family arsenite transporter
VALPIALGLRELGSMARDRRLLTLTLSLTWGLGPLLMFSLAWLVLPDQPAFRTGLILIGIAPCIAMVLIWSISFAVGKGSGLDYPRTSALAFTAAGNNFELAIAVCISIWGVSSQQALAGVIGPLIEVPVLVSLVYVSLWLRPRFRVQR